MVTLKKYGEEGLTLKEIADKYGVTKQRIQQLLKMYLPEWKELYGGVVRRRVKADEYYAKHGKKEDTDLYRAKKHKFNRKKANALKVGYSWDIQFGDLEWPSLCPILGIELNYFAETRLENSPSFDRVDSTKGYEKGNVVVVSWRANRIKNDGTIEEHEAIVKYLKTLHT